ncbi:MAG: radical SAM protein [Candidatus Aureabacteria bacterium]|nr:radical SAM protein [Candidatus Auribacterota bacterium]
MKTIPHMIYADSKRRIYDHPDYQAAAFDGRQFVVPEKKEYIRLPEYSKFFIIPGAKAVGFNPAARSFEAPDKEVVAVAAFMRPGYVRLYHPAFLFEDKDRDYLPLWAYTAAAFSKNHFYVPAVHIDANKRWQPEHYDDREILPRISALKKKFRKNRLIEHLTRCAVHYHCFAAKNLFMGRWEAPLPVSRGCNARCLGCISLQKEEFFPASHERISFKPSVKEIKEVAVHHLEKAKESIVSFGQGCEGEPLMDAELIAYSIREIRKSTEKGVIHLNTNGYSPERVRRLCDAGLDSIRISLSSARKNLYDAYYRPVNYAFSDVIESIKACSEKGIYTAINYLVFPGISDEEEEWQAFKTIILHVRPHFVHFKNLNIDPFFYLDKMKQAGGCSTRLLGIKAIIDNLKRDFPKVKLGYFNRTKKEIQEHLKSV